MVSKELSKAAVEINSIFDNMTSEALEKIPEEFRKFLKRIASKTYVFQYDKTKRLEKQNLLPKTKGVLALIYKDFLCNEEERQEYIKTCKKVLVEKK